VTRELSKAEQVKAERDESLSALRVDAALTRARIVEDIDALEDKLSVENIRAEAKQAIVETVRESAADARDSALRAVKLAAVIVRRNPAAFITLGVLSIGFIAWRARRA
jgi:hypothetical protein